VNVPGPPKGEAVKVSSVPGLAFAWFTVAVTEGAGLMVTTVAPLAVVDMLSVDGASRGLRNLRPSNVARRLAGFLSHRSPKVHA